MIYPTGPAPAKIMIVGEFPSEQDINSKQMFSGYAGTELGKMLSEVGISRAQCFITCVLRERPYANDLSLYMPMKKSDVTDKHVLVGNRMVAPAVLDGLEILKREIELCQPNIIIALGNLALWAVTGEWGVGNWRGSEMVCTLRLALDYSPKVIPTYSPNTIMGVWSWRPIAVHDLRRARREALTRGVIHPDYKFVIHPDYGQVHSVLSQLLAQVSLAPLKLSVDVETRRGHIDCIGIAWSAFEAICIPLTVKAFNDPYWPDAESETEIVFLLYKLLTHPNAQVIGQNFSYDAQYIQRDFLFPPNLVRDTLIAQHSMFPNMQKDLAFLASMYCEHYTYWKEGLHGDDQTRWEYNAKDCCLTYQVDSGQQPAIDAYGLRKVFEFQQSLYEPVLETMRRGLRIDTKLQAEFSLTLLEEIDKRGQFLYEVLGEPLNPKSPTQVAQLFYSDFGQKPVLDRKTRKPSTNEEALRTIGGREPLLLPLTKAILEYRSLGVFHSTFVMASRDVDSRMRCSFNICGTETFRFSSSSNAFGSGLNLQNIPKGGDGDDLSLPNLRRLFIPDPGHTFFDIDLSSADLRIVVWESDEGEMKQMLAEGLDPYTEVAKEFYHDPAINKKDPRRQTFKSFCHGTHYFGTAKGLAERLGLSVHEAEKTQKWYFQRFPKIKRWQDNLRDRIIRDKMVTNVFGYRLPILDRLEGTLINQVAAWIPQSTVAVLTNHAYRNIFDNLKEVQILLQVHDSLAGQFPTHLTSWAMKRIVEEASITLPYEDPLVIPVGIVTSTKSWGDCE